MELSVVDESSYNGRGKDAAANTVCFLPQATAQAPGTGLPGAAGAWGPPGPVRTAAAAAPGASLSAAAAAEAGTCGPSRDESCSGDILHVNEHFLTTAKNDRIRH